MTSTGTHPHPHSQGRHLHDAPVAASPPVPAGESYGHVRGGPSVLDIGGDIGALVATMDHDATGTELHLRSEHHPPIGVHTGVWQRSQGEKVVTAAVFAELVEGTYWVLDHTGAAIHRVEVRGGELASIDLRH